MPRVRLGLMGGVGGGTSTGPLIPRIIIARQDFTKGGGYQPTYQLTTNENGTLSKAFDPSKIMTGMQVEITKPNGSPIYDNLFPRTASHRISATVDASGQVTLSTLPHTTYLTDIRISFFYRLDLDETVANYTREDIIATVEQEFEGTVIGPQASTVDAVPRFYDTGGQILKDTGVTIDDANNVNIPAGSRFLIDGVSTTDHGNLDAASLTDDDHLHYLTEGRHDSLPADNPHSVTLTQSVTADPNTDITTAELETLSDGSDADALHDHLTFLNESRHDSLPADNPHSVTITQAVTADAGTDITTTELETLSSGPASFADALHSHTVAPGLVEYNYADDDVVTSTTAITPTWTQKMRLTTAPLSGGEYRIGWFYQWYSTNANYSFTGRVQVDDTTTIVLHEQEPKDTSATQAHTVSGFKKLTLTSGSHNIDIDFSNTGGAPLSEAFIWNARLELWKVA